MTKIRAIINRSPALPANSNDCMIRVLVEDKIRPRCAAPEDIWTDCSEIPDNFDFDDFSALAAKFGQAIAEDNCSAMLEENTPDINLDPMPAWGPSLVRGQPPTLTEIAVSATADKRLW